MGTSKAPKAWLILLSPIAGCLQPWGVKSPFQANAGQPQRTALSHLALGCALTGHSLGFHQGHVLTPDPGHKLSSDSSPTLSPDHAHKPTGQNQSRGLASSGMGQR